MSSLNPGTSIADRQDNRDLPPKPVRGFVLALAGGTVSMVPYAFPLFALLRAGTSNNFSIGFVIMVVSVLLFEMPGRHVSLGALITSLSTAELASTLVILTVGGKFLHGPLRLPPSTPWLHSKHSGWSCCSSLEVILRTTGLL